MKFRVCDAVLLRKTYGNITMDELIDKIKGENIHPCPACESKGFTLTRYNAYPSGFPDSGWVEEWKYKEVECKLCNGIGFTKVLYKPKFVQDGWEQGD